MNLVLLIPVLIVLAIIVQLWGADTRPGFADGRSDRAERWFPHSRGD